jgi:hypothetical protein
MAKAAITRTLLRDLPPLPEGVAKQRIFHKVEVVVQAL